MRTSNFRINSNIIMWNKDGELWIHYDCQHLYGWGKEFKKLQLNPILLFTTCMACLKPELPVVVRPTTPTIFIYRENQKTTTRTLNLNYWSYSGGIALHGEPERVWISKDRLVSVVNFLKKERLIGKVKET